GRHGPAFVAQRVDVKHAAIASARLARDLARRLVGNRAFTENDGDLVFAHEVNDPADLLRRALRVGVDGPEIKLAQAVIAREIAERALARHQPALLLGNGGQTLAQRLVDGSDFRGISLSVLFVDFRIGGVVLGKRLADVLYVDQRV